MRRMMREALTSAPWLGVGALGWGGGFVVPSAPVVDAPRASPFRAVVDAALWNGAQLRAAVAAAQRAGDLREPIALPAGVGLQGAPGPLPARERVEWVPMTWGGAHWLAKGRRLRVWIRVGVEGGTWSALRGEGYPSHGHATARDAARWAMGDGAPAEPAA